MRRTFRPLGTAATVAVMLTACAGERSMGPIDSGSGTLQLNVSRADGAGAASAAFDGAAVAAGNVTVDLVQSLTVTLTRVDALRMGSSGNPGGWVSIELSAPVDLDLMALPTSSAGAIVLPTVDLVAGVYSNLRLVLSDATIVFSEDVSIGGGPVLTTYSAGTEYAIRIAGQPDNLRLLVPLASFEVPDGGSAEVDLFFDVATSVGSIVATPLFLLVSPVLIGSVNGN